MMLPEATGALLEIDRRLGAEEALLGDGASTRAAPAASSTVAPADDHAVLQARH